MKTGVALKAADPATVTDTPSQLTKSTECDRQPVALNPKP